MKDLVIPFGQNKWEQMYDFCSKLKQFQREAGFKISSRGWGYQLEGWGLITKDEFDVVERVINDARKSGYLPVDFVPEEDSRNFQGVVVPDEMSLEQHLLDEIYGLLWCGASYIPDYWNDEEYYIQMVVEKVDLRTLFAPICGNYRIPIANSKGWSSILQRATYARRFKDAEEKGLKPVLLYCGDHDPDGLRISDTLRKNLRDIKEVTWGDGEVGYNPKNLIIDRFGLNADFIYEHGLSWVENLRTGGGRNLASPSHPNFEMDYVQNYLAEFGAKKCEANAIVTQPEAARKLCKDAIEKYLGEDAGERFVDKKRQVHREIEELLEQLEFEEFKEEARELLGGQ